jgi:hypothetical protein
MKMIVGVNFWWRTPEKEFNERDVPLLKEIGIKHVRLGGFSETNLTQYDMIVNLLNANGIEVLGLLHREDLAADPIAFGDYVYEMVLHFKGRVRKWMIWNEPNWGAFTNNPVGYTEILKAAYTRAKQADPTITVVTGNFLSVEDGVKFLRGLYENGAKGYFDIVAVNPYCYPASPLEPNEGMDGHTFWRLPLFRDLMVAQADQDKKIWIAEFGYRTPGNGFFEGDGKGTVSEENQALYLRQALQLASTWDWIERFYIYEWMDSGDPELGWWGLIKERYNPPYETKPAFDVVRSFLSGA